MLYLVWILGAVGAVMVTAAVIGLYFDKKGE
jgi:hypothetical protein